ncbi:hypothetical protein MBLNU459_g7277t2 [Dothideomycetes sp. NU459]
MVRKIYLVCYHLSGSPAHWAIFVPEAGSTTHGKIIDVVGSPYTGFGLRFKRGYDLASTDRVNTVIELAEVADGNVVDVVGSATREDVTAHDTLEREASRVDAPVASRTPRDPAAENCQTWIYNDVNWLIRRKS